MNKFVLFFFLHRAHLRLAKEFATKKKAITFGKWRAIDFLFKKNVQNYSPNIRQCVSTILQVAALVLLQIGNGALIHRQLAAGCGAPTARVQFDGRVGQKDFILFIDFHS